MAKSFREKSIQIKEKFDKLRKDKNYTELGHIFWKAFVSLPKGEERRLYNKLFNSLTVEEQEMCE